jgi:hypothetical protein
MVVRALNWAFLGVLCALSALAVQALAAAAASDSLPVATDVRLGGDEAQTRFVMDFSRKIDMRAFTLADPYRVVIDIPQVVFQLPPKAGESGRGLIKAYRFGLVMQGGSRLVFDLAKPAKVAKAFIVDSSEGAPARLVLELAPTDGRSPSTIAPPARICRQRALRRRKATSARSSCSIRVTAASTPAPRARAGKRKRISS